SYRQTVTTGASKSWAEFASSVTMMGHGALHMPRSVRLLNQRAAERLTAAEFFAGIGLVRRALEETGRWEVVFANDIDEKKQEMYQANYHDGHFRLDDIHNLKSTDIPTCDLFTASFPCNDLSIAGAWEGLSGKESSA